MSGFMQLYKMQVIQFVINWVGNMFSIKFYCKAQGMYGQIYILKIFYSCVALA